ncbi:tautomerase family protein [Azorhizophilus paspali]|uniref:Tautomerase family protein n=1 Tax=Azorhizophilus paspali TaxID=69963 RepID=A0ABV6SFZ7_AZOPA
MKSIFRVNDEELQARYQTYDKENFHAPGGKLEYLQVEITIFKGRTFETKHKLYQALSGELAKLLNISPEAILIILNEHKAENWGMRGGIPASEIDFGYSITI